MQSVFSTTDMGELLIVPAWRIRRLFEVGDVPEPPRIGQQRAIPREMIPAITAALDKRGWLPKQEVVSA